MTFKQVLLSIAIFFTTSILFTIPACAKNMKLPQIAKNHPYYEYISLVYNQEVLNENIDPDKVITKHEFLQLMAKFTNKDTASFKTYINKQEFSTRKDIAIVLSQYLYKYEDKTVENSRLYNFPLEQLADSYSFTKKEKSAVGLVYGLGIMNAMPDGSFHLTQNITYGQACEVLVKLTDVTYRFDNHLIVDLPDVIPIPSKFISVIDYTLSKYNFSGGRSREEVYNGHYKDFISYCFFIIRDNEMCKYIIDLSQENIIFHVKKGDWVLFSLYQAQSGHTQRSECFRVKNENENFQELGLSYINHLAPNITSYNDGGSSSKRQNQYFNASTVGEYELYIAWFNREKNEWIQPDPYLSYYTQNYKIKVIVE